MKTAIIISIMAVAFLGATGFFYTAPAEAPMAPETQADYFDREDCQQTCAFDYGFDLYGLDLQRWSGRGGGGWNSARIHAYYRCLDRCDAKHWRDFDSDMDDLDRE